MVMRGEIEEVDRFLCRLFDILTDIEARDRSIPDASADGDSSQGMSFVDLMTGYFPRGYMDYTAFVLITEEDTEYSILVDKGPHHAITLIRKRRFSYARTSSIDDGLAFELEWVGEGGGEGVGEKVILRNGDSKRADEWWRQFMGPFMNLSLSPEEVTRGLKLLSLYESGAIKY